MGVSVPGVCMSWGMKHFPQAKNIVVTERKHPAYLDASPTWLKQPWSDG